MQRWTLIHRTGEWSGPDFAEQSIEVVRAEDRPRGLREIEEAWVEARAEAEREPSTDVLLSFWDRLFPGEDPPR